jgi:hypothetical protein
MNLARFFARRHLTLHRRTPASMDANHVYNNLMKNQAAQGFHRLVRKMG